jgi:glycine/D-amino acid oxidase-like deaminating enzyme
VEDRARVVIVGAGIVGCSAAEHLTKLGWRDVVVLDRGPLFEAGGSTSHAPGLVFQTNPSKTMTNLAGYGVKRYSELELDGEPCFYQVGGLEVAATTERWKDLKRRHGIATSWGVESELLSPEECVEKSPLLDPEKIRGGFYVPSDGIAKGVRISEAMAREAQARGAKFYGETEVTGIEVENGRIKAVETSRGRIEAENILSCAGMWGPRVGRMAGAFVQLLTPMQHQYAWTTPVPGLEPVSEESDHVILRHQDHAMYFRQVGERYGIGSYRHRSMPVSPDEIPRQREPGREMPSIMEFTPEDFEGPWEEPRPLRTSPFYPRQRQLGVYFLEASGWERPQWYGSNDSLLAEYDVPEMEEWAGRYWSPIVEAEHLATRERVALYDMASLKKAEVTGPGALEFLQKLNTNQLDKPVGGVTYTLMLDEAGGIKSDITVARLEENHFQLGLNGPRDIEWMERHLPEDGSVQVRDISGGTCCILRPGHEADAGLRRRRLWAHAT